MLRKLTNSLAGTHTHTNSPLFTTHISTTRTHDSRRINILTYIFVSVYVRSQWSHLFIYTHACMHMHIPPLIPAHIHSHKCILSLFLSHTHSQTHSFTHTHTHTHTQWKWSHVRHIASLSFLLWASHCVRVSLPALRKKGRKRAKRGGKERHKENQRVGCRWDVP